MKKPVILCLMGPTASGKTELAVELVQHLPCEIISVDSAMVYRGMDIGTAKPSAEILAIAPHRLLNIREPNEIYSAGNFRDDALLEIKKILQKDRIPLLAGGTMLYFHVLQNGLAELPQANEEIRNAITKEATIHGWEALHQKLKKQDPAAAQRIHPNDPQRIQRALEIYEITGKSSTELLKNNLEETSQYHFINIGLIPPDRNLLHQKIKDRFLKMLQNGFLEEVEKLFLRGDLHLNLPSIRAVGYRQAWEYFAGSISHEEMIERSIIATRQLAKRQLTWLRSWQHLNCFNSDDPKRLEKILQFLNL